MVSNIGVGSESMHTANDLKKIPKGNRQFFFMKTYEMKFPMKHPQYVVRDLKYEKFVNKELAWNSPLRYGWRKFVALVKAIQYGDFKRIAYKVKCLFFKDPTK